MSTGIMEQKLRHPLYLFDHSWQYQKTEVIEQDGQGSSRALTAA